MLNKLTLVQLYEGPAVLRVVLVKISSCELFPDVTRAAHDSSMNCEMCLFRKEKVSPGLCFPCFVLQVLCGQKENERGQLPGSWDLTASIGSLLVSVENIS